MKSAVALLLALVLMGSAAFATSVPNHEVYYQRYEPRQEYKMNNKMGEPTSSNAATYIVVSNDTSLLHFCSLACRTMRVAEQRKVVPFTDRGQRVSLLVYIHSREKSTLACKSCLCTH